MFNIFYKYNSLNSLTVENPNTSSIYNCALGNTYLDLIGIEPITFRYERNIMPFNYRKF